jgi:glycosyltransferase involved in cell wall biosynthesis
MDHSELRVLAVSHACAVDVNQWLYAHLARAGGLEVELVAPTHWRSHLRGDIPFRRLPELTCPVHILAPTCSGEDSRMHLAFYRGAGRLVERLRPEWIYLDEEPYSLAALQFVLLARRVGARCVFNTMQNLAKRLPPPFGTIEQAVYRRSAAATALTEDVATVLRAKGFRGPVTVVPLAVELSRFRPQPALDLEAELRLRRPVIGYVGRLAQAKGVDLLLEAFRRLAEEQLTFQGLIVGGGPAEAEIRAQVEALGLASRVRLAPAAPHDEVARYYNCLDIAVVPSRTMPGWKEQFGRVLIEAMACGVPVVGSDSGAIPEVIAAARGGVTFPEGDAAQLTAQLRRLLEDAPLRRHLGETGRAAVGRLYGYEAVSACLRDALLRFAGRTPWPVKAPTMAGR